MADLSASFNPSLVDITSDAASSALILASDAESKASLYTSGVDNPIFAGVTITGLTPLSLVAADVNKKLESVSLGSGLDYGSGNVLSLVSGEIDHNLLLNVHQDVNTDASPTFAGLTIDTNTLFVDAANNRVGIKTLTPLHSLDVVEADWLGSQRGIHSALFGAHAHSAHITGRRARGSEDSPITLQANDHIAGFTAEGYNGTTYERAGYLAFVTTDVSDNKLTTKAVLTVDEAGTEKEQIFSFGSGTTAIGRLGAETYSDYGPSTIYSINSIAGNLNVDGESNRQITLYAKGTYSGSAPIRVFRGYGQIPADNTNNYSSVNGITFWIEHLGSGDVTDLVLYGGSLTLNNADATVTNLVGFRAFQPTITAGSIANQAGINVWPLTQATNNTYLLIGSAGIPDGNYGIYDASTYNNYFAGNIGVGQITFGTSATKTLALGTGVTPTSSPADAFQMYSKDFAAGNACPYFRTENGTEIGLNQNLLTTANSTFVRGTFTQTTGTAPLTISSTTVCTNLNADLWDGYQFSDYLNQSVKTTISPTFAGQILTPVTSLPSPAIKGKFIIYDDKEKTAMYFGKMGQTNAVAQWKMNDNAENTTVIESINSLNSTSQRNTNLMSVAGKINTSLNFNGTDDYITVALNDLLNIGTSDFALSFWIKTQTTSLARIINKILNVSPYTGFDVWLEAGSLRYMLADDMGYTSGVFTDFSLVNNNWHHVVLNYDRDDKLTPYVNGSPKTTKDISSKQGSINVDIALIIEARCSSFLHKLEGMMDDIRIYKRLLTTTEIAALYNNGNGAEYGEQPYWQKLAEA